VSKRTLTPAGAPRRLLRPGARKPAATCEWFLRCGRPATRSTPHPVLGSVPTCERCHEFATRDDVKQTLTCGWRVADSSPSQFHVCGAPATRSTPHPVLGSVPTCERCHEYAERDVWAEEDDERAELEERKALAYERASEAES